MFQIWYIKIYFKLLVEVEIWMCNFFRPIKSKYWAPVFHSLKCKFRNFIFLYVLNLNLLQQSPFQIPSIELIWLFSSLYSKFIMSSQTQKISSPWCFCYKFWCNGLKLELCGTLDHLSDVLKHKFRHLKLAQFVYFEMQIM